MTELRSVGRDSDRESPAHDFPRLTLEAVHRRFLEHARWMIKKCNQAGVLMMMGYSHTRIRAFLQLTPAQYRAVRAWWHNALLSDVDYEKELPPDDGKDLPKGV